MSYVIKSRFEKKALVFVIILMLISDLVLAIDIHGVQDARCGTWKDSLEQGSEVQGRVDFAIKCLNEDSNELGKKIIALSSDPSTSDREILELKSQKKGTLNLMKMVKSSLAGVYHNSGHTVTAGYPFYGILDGDGEPINPLKWFAPKDASTSCSVIPTTGIDFDFDKYIIVGFCASGCYTPEQLLLTPQGEVEIGTMYKNKADKIVTLDSISTLDHLVLKNKKIEKYITDAKAGKQEIIKFQLLSGNTLSVTTNHPIVTSIGIIKEAKNILVGESFVTSEGDIDPVISKDSYLYFGKVYNIKPVGTNNVENIIVAQNYLNGSVYYQNENIGYLNRMILRTNLVKNIE